jgi:hypothetical protein
MGKVAKYLTLGKQWERLPSTFRVHIKRILKKKKKTLAAFRSGSGIWAIEVATAYPHCEIFGIDLVCPGVGDQSLPKNCSFKTANGRHAFSWYTKVGIYL